MSVSLGPVANRTLSSLSRDLPSMRLNRLMGADAPPPTAKGEAALDQLCRLSVTPLAPPVSDEKPEASGREAAFVFALEHIV